MHYRRKNTAIFWFTASAKLVPAKNEKTANRLKKITAVWQYRPACVRLKTVTDDHPDFFLPAPASSLALLGSLGWAEAVLTPHAGRCDGNGAIEVLREVVMWWLLACLLEVQRHEKSGYAAAFVCFWASQAV